MACSWKCKLVWMLVENGLHAHTTLQTSFDGAVQRYPSGHVGLPDAMQHWPKRAHFSCFACGGRSAKPKQQIYFSYKRQT